MPHRVLYGIIIAVIILLIVGAAFSGLSASNAEDPTNVVKVKVSRSWSIAAAILNCVLVLILLYAVYHIYTSMNEGKLVSHEP